MCITHPHIIRVQAAGEQSGLMRGVARLRVLGAPYVRIRRTEIHIFTYTLCVHNLSLWRFGILFTYTLFVPAQEPRVYILGKKCCGTQRGTGRCLITPYLPHVGQYSRTRGAAETVSLFFFKYLLSGGQTCAIKHTYHVYPREVYVVHTYAYIYNSILYSYIERLIKRIPSGKSKKSQHRDAPAYTYYRVRFAREWLFKRT